jgi:hypothetical protein
VLAVGHERDRSMAPSGAQQGEDRRPG